jgi:uncharacterized coiled-coil DUF342 family protein
MLDEKEFNKKVDELYEQDTMFINQIDKLYVLINEVVNKMVSLKSTVDEQQRKIDVLMKYDKLELYRVIWETGHTQTVFAHDVRDAREKIMKDFTGSDKITNIIMLE